MPNRLHARCLTVLLSLGLFACGSVDKEEPRAIEPGAREQPGAVLNHEERQGFIFGGGEVLGSLAGLERPQGIFPGSEGVKSLIPDERDAWHLNLEEMQGLALPVASAVGGGVDLEPNIIRGKVRFSNQNPDILALMAADPWHSGGSVSVSSTNPVGFSASTGAVKYTNPSEFTFEMLVEAAAGGEAGVVYNVNAWRGGAPSFSLAGVRVRPKNIQPGPTEVELSQCVGVVQIQIGTDDTCKTPASIYSVGVHGLSTFTSGNYFTGYVLAGASAKTSIYYHVNTSGGLVQALLPVEWTSVGCDEIVRICKAVVIPPPPPPPPPLPPPGAITGPWEVIGERFSYFWGVSAWNGPRGSRKEQSFSGAPPPTAPVSDPSKWWKLTNLPEGNYSLGGTGYLRQGREFTQFSTSSIAATVVANNTTPVTMVVNGETRYPFSMRPAYFYGSMRLADPYVSLHPGSTSTLQSLYFEGDYDSNHDGVPDKISFETRLYAFGGGGGSMTAFEGRFNTTSGELSSNYEQVLPNPYDLSYTWSQAPLRFRFWSEGFNPTLFTKGAGR